LTRSNRSLTDSMGPELCSNHMVVSQLELFCSCYLEPLSPAVADNEVLVAHC
jgi:hypothetical protein